MLAKHIAACFFAVFVTGLAEQSEWIPVRKTKLDNDRKAESQVEVSADAEQHFKLTAHSSALAKHRKAFANHTKFINMSDVGYEIDVLDKEIGTELAIASEDVQQAEALLHRGGELAYGVILGLTGLLVSTIYSDRGTLVVAATVFYVTALSTIPLGLKQLMSVQGFNFPAFITAWHLLCTSVGGAALLKLQGIPVLCIGTRSFLINVLPIAFLFSASVVLINTGMSYSSVHFFEMVSAATPLGTCAVAHLFGRPVHSNLVLPLVIVATAFAICFTGEVHFSRKGFLLLLLGNGCRAIRSVLYQMMLQPSELEPAVHPLQLVTWIAGASFPMMVCWSLLIEGTTPLILVRERDWLELAFTTMIAFVLNVSGTYCIRELGAIGAQVAGELSDMTVAMGAMAMFGETMTTGQTLSYLVMCCGITWYTKRDKALQDCKQEKAIHSETSSLITPMANPFMRYFTKA